MALRRKSKSKPAKDNDTSNNNGSTPKPSADPYTSETTEGSLVWTTTRFIENLFSHRGMFWLGVAIALVSYICNTWFYFGLLANATDFAAWQALLGAVFISSSTTLFEVMPLAVQRSHRNALNQIFVAGAKPQDLPELNTNIVGDADQLIAAYRNADRDTNNFFRLMRWIAIGVEVFLGVLFMGSIGTGAQALMSLGLFIASIFATEWGVSLALRAAQWELPPQIRKQLDELISNAGKALNLRRV